MFNIWVLHKPSKKTNWHLMLQMWVLHNHFNKTNVYFVTFMQVFHIELYVFEVLLMQWCKIGNIFQTCIFRNFFYKALIQCSHSKHANIQTWGYNCNKTKLVCIDLKYHIYQNFLKCPKTEKHELHVIVYAKET
jgi:hypothetical protein